MADATIHNPAPLVAPLVNDEDFENDYGAEIVAMTTSSSPTHGATKMMEFFKKTTTKLMTIVVGWLVTYSPSSLR
jgi:hypothetical protein